ncbi:methyltransferase domain-containing protein [Actinoplanes sp. NPDC051861]|uniref:methyltransferase domain-containing protein n=1 Tax=Actinoplanes sp. NPDC051861 TaxID=3155170 RepID=UPI0034202D2E
MRGFQELIDEAVAVDVEGWDFGWLDGRATEERPPWGYVRMLADRLPRAGAALDLDTGGGEIVAEMPVLPARMVVTEGWAPNVEHARTVLGPRGVEVVHVEQRRPLPFGDGTFDLVTSRHPVDPPWSEISRVLRVGGSYLAQHVGPASAYELIEIFLGPLPRQLLARDPDREASAAIAAGMEVTALRTARCRMELFDVGAVVYLLRKCVWWVPDFSVDRYRERLEWMDGLLRENGVFVAHSTRTLIEAKKQ